MGRSRDALRRVRELIESEYGAIETSKRVNKLLLSVILSALLLAWCRPYGHIEPTGDAEGSIVK